MKTMFSSEAMSSSLSSSSKKKIILRSSDGVTFEVDEAVAIQSGVIRQRVENDCADGVFPLANVTSGVLSKVIEYCEKHAKSAAPDSDDRAAVDQLENFDAQFVKVDQTLLFDLILAVLNEIFANRNWDIHRDHKVFILLSTQTGEVIRTLICITVDVSQGCSCSVQEHMGVVDDDTLRAANYLDMKALLDLTCQAVADMIKGKTPEEIRKTFNCSGEFTPEEEEEVRRENTWAFE
ncbi:hypothetical protein RHMOL_Rhmol02G0225100 [Rhododendron molle]|uniref:Uncharacterized protein n=1 Tax=Rhododendron molle TaxID=49168 RepID=A0ACC0PUS9_RHOML|nr:hypothetical protein RHMOL_Rhmol02G0225100 [Rhododendron molle]